jgi:hypothetical protein
MRLGSSYRLLALPVAVTLAACSSDPDVLKSSARPSTTTSSSGGGASADASVDDPEAPDASLTSGGDAAAPPPVVCTPGLTSVQLALTPSPEGPVRAAVTADGGTVVAWAGGGQVHVRRLDGAGNTVGADRSIAGDTVHGVAPMAGAVALLVARSPDVLALVKLDAAGAASFDVTIVGNTDHATVGSQWFDADPQFFSEAGRLAWSGSKLFVYVPIYRHWNDGVSHTGDTLRTFDVDGQPTTGPGWAWGCSHSLDVRLSTDGATQICLSDCYPQKGILLARKTLVSSEPSGTCAGRSDAKLGGLATVKGASWITLASREGRTSRDVALVKIGDSTKRWLTQGSDATSPHLAAFSDGMLAGWKVGGAASVQRLDAQGNPVGAPEAVGSLAFGTGDDFLGWPGGDAGWLVPANGGWKLARFRACE